jgi:hypothetical protein
MKDESKILVNERSLNIRNCLAATRRGACKYVNLRP